MKRMFGLSAARAPEVSRLRNGRQTRMPLNTLTAPGYCKGKRRAAGLRSLRSFQNPGAEFADIKPGRAGSRGQRQGTVFRLERCQGHGDHQRTHPNFFRGPALFDGQKLLDPEKSPLAGKEVVGQSQARGGFGGFHRKVQR